MQTPPRTNRTQMYPRPHLALSIVLALTTGFTVVSGMPFLAERAGIQFLPDPDIFRAWRDWLLAGAYGLAGLVFVFLMAAPERGRLFGVLRLVAPVVYVVIFYIGLSTALPMIWTTLAGHPSAMVVTVADPQGTPTSRCKPAVQLHSMPILFDRLCNIPPEMMMTLTRGDKVLLIGKRSRLGVIYHDARLLPQGWDV